MSREAGPWALYHLRSLPGWLPVEFGQGREMLGFFHSAPTLAGAAAFPSPSIEVHLLPHVPSSHTEFGLSWGSCDTVLFFAPSEPLLLSSRCLASVSSVFRKGSPSSPLQGLHSCGILTEANLLVITSIFHTVCYCCSCWVLSLDFSL